VRRRASLLRWSIRASSPLPVAGRRPPGGTRTRFPYGMMATFAALRPRAAATGCSAKGRAAMGNDPQNGPDNSSHDEPAPLLEYPSIGTEEDFRGGDPLPDLLVPEAGAGEADDDRSQ
jgi:hypothetical protein